MPHSISEALTHHQHALGTWVQMNSPETCQIAGLAGYDFIIIDMEHGALGISETANLIRTVSGSGMDAIVRVPDQSVTNIRRVLDAGAAGVLVPGIKTAEEARNAIAATKYEPSGLRGACPCVPSVLYGTIPWSNCREHSSDPLIWLLIEHRLAIENIDEIVATKPDAIALGPFDLSMSLGLNGEYSHPDVLSSLNMATEAARAIDVDVVYVALDFAPELSTRRVVEARDRGCRIATTFIDRTLLAYTYTETVKSIRSSLI